MRPRLSSLQRLLEALISYQYIIDIDNTVKPIYGHQEGAELGYNPIKPGRPSHNWRVVIQYAFRLLLIPDPSLRALVPIR